MRPAIGITIAVLGAGVLVSVCAAQQRQGQQARAGAGSVQSGTSSADAIVARMLAFDKNGDGKLSREEITDARLLRLFDQADTNKDGVVTREELTARARQMAGEAAASDGGPRAGFAPLGGPEAGFDGPGGPGGPEGGFGGPGGFGPPGGGGGPGGPGGPPQPGQILPSFLQERLRLTDGQKQQVAALQNEVDARLAKILSEDQNKQLQGMRQRRGGPDGPGGPGGGFGGPGGPPPGGGPDDPGQPR